jgi:hypothetical protein
VSSIRTREQPATHGQRGLDVVSVPVAAEESLQTGARVAIIYPVGTDAASAAPELASAPVTPIMPAREWAILLEGSSSETNSIRTELAHAFGATDRVARRTSRSCSFRRPRCLVIRFVSLAD